MERLRLVEAQAVERAHLVSVRVLLRGPGSAIPVLTVARVSRGKLVRSHLLELQLARVVKLNRGVAAAPVRAVQGGGGEVGGAEGSSIVVNGLVVRGGPELGLGAVTTGVGVELLVDLANPAVVESGGGEVVLGVVERRRVEHLARLLSDGLAEMVVVLAEARHVALVAGEHSGLALNGGLSKMDENENRGGELWI